jgi:hypothetical protein
LTKVETQTKNKQKNKQNMKKSLLLGIVSLAATAATSFGQGVIFLDNYNVTGGIITYGAGVPANGVSGANGSQGTGLLAGWTIGLYFAVGNVATGDSAGNGLPSGLLAAATGANSTAVSYTSAFNSPGQFAAPGVWVVPGTLSTGGQTLTAEVVAWSGASYASATYRGHSAPFTMTTSSSSSPAPNSVGPSFTSFSVSSVAPVPEPSTLALAGLGGFGMLMAFRRKK